MLPRARGTTIVWRRFESSQGCKLMPIAVCLRKPLTTLAAVCLVCSPSLTQALRATPIDWTDWSAATVGSPTGGTAAGTIGSINVSYSGEVTGNTVVGAGFAPGSGYPSWGPTTTFSGGTIDNTPTYGDIIGLDGGSSAVNTITFSTPVVNPVMAIWSLGSGGAPTSFQFDAGEPFTIESGGPSNEYGGSTIYTVASPLDAVFGNEGNGTIQFSGTYSSLTWTNPQFEAWFGFTVGVPVPEPASATLAIFGLAASVVWWRRRLA